MYRRVSADRRLSGLLDIPKEAPKCMATAKTSVLLSLRKQETHYGNNVPESQLPILPLWRYNLPAENLRRGLGEVYMRKI